jgi:hypothetical protein
VHRLWLQASSASAPCTAPYIRRSRDQHVVGRATRIASSNTTRARTPSGREELSTTARDQSIWSGACEPVQQRKVHQIPNAPPLPIAQAPPARHSRSAPEFLREHLPGNAAAKDEDDARQARAIRDAWSATLWRRGRIGKKGSTRSHNRSGSNSTAIRRSRYFADEDQVREVLARLLNAG